ncbi:MAG: hypothetical protein AB1898_10395 [Acidobacteriota bacterium]
MGIRKLFVLIALVLVAGALWLFHPEKAEHFQVCAAVDSQWGRDALWDDGLAEVATYESRRVVYGKSRVHEAILITVKEDFSKKFYTKADFPEKTSSFPVLKLNIVSEIPTDNYTYHYLTSVFVRREDPMSLVKLTVGSQEWCGSTFKVIRAWETHPRMIFHSYFEGEGGGSYSLEFSTGDLAEDQLLISLRALPFRQGFQLKTRILDSIVDNRAPEPSLHDATISVSGQESIEGRSTWKVDVQRKDLHQSYWYDRPYPHTLVKLASSDGRELQLRDVRRRRYW